MRKKDPLFPATFHQGCPYLTIIYHAVNYILTSRSVSGSLGVRFPRGPKGRGPAPHHQHSLQPQRPPSPAPPEGLAEHACVRTEPRAGANPTDRTDRQGQGGPDLACQISAAKTRRRQVFGDGPLEADWPVCRGLIIPGGVRLLNAQRPAPRGGRCRRSHAPVTASLEQGSGRPRIVLGRPILVRGFSPGDPLRSAGTSPAPRPRPGSQA